MKLQRGWIVCSLATLLSGAALVSCSDRDTFEDAGESIDRGLDDAKDTIDNAVDETGDAIEDTADDVEDAVDDPNVHEDQR